MVLIGPRRSRSGYALPLRHFGTTVNERLDLKEAKALYIRMINAAILTIVPLRRRRLCLQAQVLLARINLMTAHVVLRSPIFINRLRTLNSFSDNELYDMRMTSRENVRQIMFCTLRSNNQYPLLQNRLVPLVRWECDNGTVEDLETGFMMWLHWATYPKKLFNMQIVFGREYSQISRVLKAVWTHLNREWRHLVENNMAYFVPRFPEYNRCFRVKYQQLHGHPCSPRHLLDAMMTDGHKLRIKKDLAINYSGHKHMYCYSNLITSTYDGMIITHYGAKAGSVNDHTLQTDSNLGADMFRLQVGNAAIYKIGTDKGLHAAACVVPMHNNTPNTPAHDRENREYSSLRVSNEWDVGRPQGLFSWIDYHKGLFTAQQPIGLMFRVCCIITNAITILDGNLTAEYFDCRPPRDLDGYFR